MYRKNMLTIVAVGMLAVGISGAGAGTITVPNGDFETIYKPGTTITGVLVGGGASGAWTLGVGPDCPIDHGQYNFADETSGTLADIPGWFGYDDDLPLPPPYYPPLPGNNQGAVANQDNHSDGGVNCYAVCGSAWGNPIGGLIVSAEPLERPDCAEGYVLSMYAKGTSEPAATPVVFDLLVDEEVVTPDAEVSPVLTSEWQEFTRTYDTLPAGDITVMIGVGRDAEGSQTRFDDVTLTYDEPITYHVDGASGDNGNDGLTRETAFATIGRGITEAADCDTVLVWPGVYVEDVDFVGKAITVRSAADAAHIIAAGSYAVSFHTAEGLGSRLENFVIRDSWMGIHVVGGDCTPTIRYVTVVGNEYGIQADTGGDPNISHAILWNNNYDLIGCAANYSWVQSEGDPRFADPLGGDYHLLSERGRYMMVDPNDFGGKEAIWVLDEVSSPCIDAGDPTIEPSAERSPNGGRVNIGAYGGTGYASMSEAWPVSGDVNRDGICDLADFLILAADWLDVTAWYE